MSGKEVISLSAKERDRLGVLYRVETKTLKLKEAAEILGVSVRQMGRIWQRYKKGGVPSLCHRLRGMPGNRAKCKALREEAVRLYAEKYRDFGPTLAAEKMKARDGVEVNRETLRRWLLHKSLWPGKTLHRKHRKKRPRKEHFGEMVQMDGSDHKWFEDRHDPSCLMVMVDDATGHTEAHMGREETTHDALLVLRKWVEKHGVPASLYTDRKNIYVSDRPPTEEEKKLGAEALTEFGRVCFRLGIRIITANSPQAKGRVERKNGVLQDRFVKELRLQGISDIGGANGIMDEFTRELNQKFCVLPLKEANYHRQLPPGTELNRLFRRENWRRLQNDWTFEREGVVYQVESAVAGLRPGGKLTLCHYLDETVHVEYRGCEISVRRIGRKK